MSETTAIEWADATWSPVWGCQQISPACDNCYAMALAHRFGTGWNGAPYREFGDHHWNEPVRWNRRAAAAGTRPRVFPSMCDPLDKDWPDGVRERFWRLVDATPYLTWLILTKRVGNIDRLGPAAILGRWPANVWLGATVANREEMLRDAPKLRAIPAAVLFWSYEPALGDLGAIPRELIPDWVIAGGESGRGARPAHPDWFRSLRDQCATAGVPYLFKRRRAQRIPGGLMRNISFAMTTDQIMEGTKDVTRRLGWLHAKIGDQLRPVRKCMGLRSGERIDVLRDPITVVSLRREPLRAMLDDTEYGFAECVREGFGAHPDYRWPSAFVGMFCATHRGCTPETIVTRIEFRYGTQE